MARPERDRTRSWAASGAGKCLRSRQFAWLGAPAKPVEDTTLAIFENGHWVHRRHQAIGMAAGYLNDVEIPVVSVKHNLIGTMDAQGSDETPIEYKSINEKGFMDISSFGPDEFHVEQMHSYMLAGDFEFFRILYENKNRNTMKEFLVVRDESIITKVETDLEKLNESMSNQILQPILPECLRKEGRYRYCPFASICHNASYPALKERLDIRATSSSAAA